MVKRCLNKPSKVYVVKSMVEIGYIPYRLQSPPTSEDSFTSISVRLPSIWVNRHARRQACEKITQQQQQQIFYWHKITQYGQFGPSKATNIFSQYLSKYFYKIKAKGSVIGWLDTKLLEIQLPRFLKRSLKCSQATIIYLGSN